MMGSHHNGEKRQTIDDWTIGTSADIAWVTHHAHDATHIPAIPPLFDAYATVDTPDGDLAKTAADRALVTLLRAHTPQQPWWLGYLETGAANVVFPAVQRVHAYWDWPYVLVEAGPEQALSWRGPDEATPWHSGLPELLFPRDHSWLVSLLWDDDWRYVGGPAPLIDAILAHPGLTTQPGTVRNTAES